MKKVKFDGDARGQKGKHLEKKRRNATLLANTPKRRKMDGTLAHFFLRLLLLLEIGSLPPLSSAQTST